MNPTMAVLYLLLLYLSSRSTALFTYTQCEGTSTNSTTTAAFQYNLNILLASFSSTNSTFTTEIRGSSSSDRAYGLALCQADVSLSLCSACFKSATDILLQQCPNYTQAIVWHESCQVRYSDAPFFSSVDTSDPVQLVNGVNATDPDAFIKSEVALLKRLRQQAAYNSSLMFASGTARNSSGAPKIYGMVQCTRDLSKDGCGDCLQQIFADFWQCCDAQQGGRILAKTCSFRYEVYSFFPWQPSATLDVPSPNSSTPGDSPAAPNVRGELQGSKNSSSKVLSIALPVVVAALVLIFILSICFWRRLANNKKCKAVLEAIASAEFDLSILKIATSNFADSNKLGRGGFGTVYRGTLNNGEEIAVKRLSASSRQGIEQLKNELQSVSELRHKNLVRLRGVCMEEEEKLLVYEYVPKGSLDKFLFDPMRCRQLNWEKRFTIIKGIARGLQHVHEETHLKIVHRDLKASNILLDENMNPKISDFGLARLFEEDETQRITRRVVGTFGYMAPEYVRHGQFSVKSDVYSFGILILEIITGRKSYGFPCDTEDARDILSYTWKHWRNGTALDVMDTSRGETCSRNEVLRCIQIALLCAQEVPADRPPMSSVFLMLHSPSMTLQAPTQPSFVAVTSNFDSNVSREQSTSGYSYELIRKQSH